MMTMEQNVVDPGTEHTSLTGRAFLKMLSTNVGEKNKKNKIKNRNNPLKTAAKSRLKV